MKSDKRILDFVDDKLNSKYGIGENYYEHVKRILGFIKELNPKVTDEQIDSFKESYKSFAWSVAIAPADNPEIAVVAMIPQGESSSNAMLLIREVLGSYFDLAKNKVEKNNKNDENTDIIDNENINFVSQMKK